MLLVTGGNNGGNNGGKVDTTEVLPLTGPGAGSWREAGRLPSPRENIRAARFGNLLYVAGGREANWPAPLIDKILAWDDVSESWSVAGHMKTTLWPQAFVVTEVPLKLAAKSCSGNN